MLFIHIHVANYDSKFCSTFKRMLKDLVVSSYVLLTSGLLREHQFTMDCSYINAVLYKGL